MSQRSMTTTEQRTLTIVDPSHISADLHALSVGDYALTVSFEATPVHYPAALVRIDRERRDAVFEVADLPDIRARLNAQSAFTLHAVRSSETLRFEMPAVEAVKARGAKLAFTCALPSRLVVSRQRGVFRARLTGDMRVGLSLFVTPSGAPIAASLKDLSLGGCLVALPRQLASELHPGRCLQRIQALFPNGDNFHEAGRISHMRCAERGDHVLVGIEFTPRSRAFERQLWYFVREIEREAARRKRQGSKALCPSPLFAPAQRRSVPLSRRAVR